MRNTQPATIESNYSDYFEMPVIYLRYGWSDWNAPMAKRGANSAKLIRKWCGLSFNKVLTLSTFTVCAWYRISGQQSNVMCCLVYQCSNEKHKSLFRNEKSLHFIFLLQNVSKMKSNLAVMDALSAQLYNLRNILLKAIQGVLNPECWISRLLFVFIIIWL